MKQKDAELLIAQLIEQGKTNEEIIEVVKSQDGKIGTKNVTDEMIVELIEKVKSDENDNEPDDEGSISEAEGTNENGCHNYEKWRCSATRQGKDIIIEKDRKIRDVKITDLQAGCLNQANASNSGYCIRYFKK